MGIGHGQIYITPLRCGSWSCRRCAARNTAIWANRVSEVPCERFVTFTKIGKTRPEINYGLQHIIRDFRRAGLVFEYWGVIELHVSGVPHMHCIQSGSYMPMKIFKGIITRNGWGHSDIRRVKNPFEQAWYCAKHLCHSHGRRWDGRLVRYSRHFFPETAKARRAAKADPAIKWQLEFGRAELLVQEAYKQGVNVVTTEMGVDWLEGEKRVKDQVIRSIPRESSMGYCGKGINWRTLVELNS